MVFLNDPTKLERRLLENDACLLCDGVPNTVAIFTPEDSQRFGADGRKRRYVRYCLCRDCFEKTKDAAGIQEIEDVILRKVMAGNN